MIYLFNSTRLRLNRRLVPRFSTVHEIYHAANRLSMQNKQIAMVARDAARSKRQ
jgi:hypothetical protein